MSDLYNAYKEGDPGSRYVPTFGKYEGLSDRLRDTAKRLCQDRTIPWIGLGLIDDMIAAADKLDGLPEQRRFTERDIATQAPEYDL